MSALIDLLTAHAYSDDIDQDCECGWVNNDSTRRVQKAWAAHVQQILTDAEVPVNICIHPSRDVLADMAKEALKQRDNWAQKISYALGGIPGESNLTPDQAVEKIQGLGASATAPSDAEVNLGYWLASVLGEHIDSFANEELVTTVQRLVDKVVAEQAKATPSLPPMKSPEALRSVATVLATFSYLRFGEMLPQERIAARGVADRLHREADRLEREQAENAAREQAIEKAARMIVDRVYGFSWGEARESERAASETIARDLADAGLLNTRHGES